MPIKVVPGPELQLECKSNVRFVAMATVPLDNVDWVIRTMEEFEIVIPIVSREAIPLDLGSTQMLACAAFPPDGCATGEDLDWSQVSECLQPLGGVALRRIINLAEGEIGVEFLGSEIDVTRLCKCLEEAELPRKT
ncbi:MAG: hypothetical protein JWO36_6371 [Myxococcales bacterium]|nr:hypothetical protein [Myxococcales bacterium]